MNRAQRRAVARKAPRSPRSAHFDTATLHARWRELLAAGMPEATLTRLVATDEALRQRVHAQQQEGVNVTVALAVAAEMQALTDAGRTGDAADLARYYRVVGV